MPCEGNWYQVSADRDKVHYVFDNIGLRDLRLNDAVNLSRIGKKRDDNKARLIKLTVANNAIREKIVKSAPSLKETDGMLSSVFINRDSHPVYQKEHHRLRKKLAEVKRNEQLRGNINSDAKIVKGELIVNGTVVDRNIFLE